MTENMLSRTNQCKILPLAFEQTNASSYHYRLTKPMQALTIIV